jgi:hypothetical protein
MPSTTTVPVTITPDADAYIDEIGKRQTYGRMLEHIPVHYVDAKAVAVTLGHDHEGERPPQVLLEVMRDNPDPQDRANQLWDRWVIAHFPPQDSEHFVVL